MPSKSSKQKRTMAAAAHDPTFARKMGIPQSVAREYHDADTRKPLSMRQARKAMRGR